MSQSAIYPGSFDPITNGHLDIIQRAKKLFSSLTIAIIQNPQKKHRFTLEERKDMIKDTFKGNTNIHIDFFEGLLVDYAKKQGIYTIIRGLRAVSDFEYELQLSLTNRNLEAKLETVFLMTDEKYSFISSSLVKEIAQHQGAFEQFVPKPVQEKLKETFK